MGRWFIAVALVSCAWAVGERPSLSGTWQMDAAHSQFSEDKMKSETIQIQQKEDSIQLTEDMTDPAGRERRSDVSCNTVGKECKLKGEQVSFWYNGGALIMMEIKHNNEVVTKKSLKASEDGRTLNMEVTHIAPAGEKNETLTFHKQ